MTTFHLTADAEKQADGDLRETGDFRIQPENDPSGQDLAEGPARCRADDGTERRHGGVGDGICRALEVLERHRPDEEGPEGPIAPRLHPVHHGDLHGPPDLGSPSPSGPGRGGQGREEAGGEGSNRLEREENEEGEDHRPEQGRKERPAGLPGGREPEGRGSAFRLLQEDGRGEATGDRTLASLQGSEPGGP